MQIIGADHQLIYNGTNGFVVVFHPENNGEFDVKCYYNRSIFDNQRIIDMLRMANSCPEGSHYDVVYSAIDQINFTEGNLLQIEPYAIVLVAVFSTSGRYTFYTNLPGDSVRRSETFAGMMKHLYYSILKHCLRIRIVPGPVVKMMKRKRMDMMRKTARMTAVISCLPVRILLR